MMIENEARTFFQIYALIDPRDHLIYYIGRSRDAESRLRQHQLETSVQVRQWMDELKRSNLEPILKIIENIEVIHSSTVSEHEDYWIQTYLQRGVPLLNTQGVRTKYPRYTKEPEIITYYPLDSTALRIIKKEV